ncbi:selenium-dependent molybdenum cofactor biosynthesis protein YqeB, partial [Thermodesulfobacteriota bacterium]
KKENNKMSTQLNQLVVGIKGAGEMASAIAWRLYQANISRIFMMEIPHPIAVRRAVSFCEAVHDGNSTVEGVEAQRVDDSRKIKQIWDNKQIAVLMDPGWITIAKVQPQVVIDAILAKKNTGTAMTEAPLVIGLGPGFIAAKDVHMVVETNRGHNLGRIIAAGGAERDTGIPGDIGGYTVQRVLRAPADGIFQTTRAIADQVKPGDIIGTVEAKKVSAEIGGILRGLIRSDTRVPSGLKLGDIDSRGDAAYCYTISDKGRAIAGSVLEAILRKYNI